MLFYYLACEGLSAADSSQRSARYYAQIALGGIPYASWCSWLSVRTGYDSGGCLSHLDLALPYFFVNSCIALSDTARYRQTMKPYRYISMVSSTFLSVWYIRIPRRTRPHVQLDTGSCWMRGIAASSPSHLGLLVVRVEAGYDSETPSHRTRTHRSLIFPAGSTNGQQ